MRVDRSLLSWMPLLVGAVSIGITVWLWRHEQVTMQRALVAEFDASLRQTASRIDQRMASYEQMLRGVQGLFRATGQVGREAFARYVDAQLAGADSAGLQLFAYAARLKGSGPDGTVASRVVYVAPDSSLNLKALGDDPYAEPARRAAMQLAADSGGIGITHRLEGLVDPGRDGQPGFVMMVLPVYARGRPTDSVDARREAIAGWVFAGIRATDLMSSLYGDGTPGIEARLYDGVDANRQTLMYESAARGAAALPPRLHAHEYIGFGGHTWTLEVSAGAGFEERHGAGAARIIAISGAGLSLLLALLTRQLVNGRQHALAVARSMTRELRASEERYRRIVETADEGILTTDAQGRISFVNPKMAAMLGHPADGLLGRPVAELLAPPGPETGPALSPPGATVAPGAHELRLRRQDGAALWVSMTTTAIIDTEGRPAGWLAMVTDITGKKQAEATRTELEAQLRESQKMQAIGTLAGGIAHDFNNILAAILGNVALAEHPGLDAATRGRLEQISQSAERARSLVRQILAFSRRQPHRLVDQPLRPVVEESVRLMRPILPAQVVFDASLSDTPLNARADATQLHQVLLNLYTNAWHALNGQAGRIGVGLDAVTLDDDAAQRLGLAPGRHAHLWVSDTGCGMDEATRTRVFEPFFTTKPVGQGTGLGLSVVHGIVAGHQGAIAVDSAPGQGSRFDLYLPIVERHAPVQPSAMREPGPAPAQVGHVLYVDDDPVMVAMVHALLQRAGHRVTSFEDPRDALATLRAGPEAFDLVVTDHNMPELSGLDIAEALVRLRPDLPVVITSGFVSEEMKAAALRVGVRSVLQKEYTLERLPDIVRRLLAESRAGIGSLPEPTAPGRLA